MEREYDIITPLGDPGSAHAIEMLASESAPRIGGERSVGVASVVVAILGALREQPAAVHAWTMYV